MNLNKNQSSRLLSYDVIRIVALLSIVMVHISAYMVINFDDTSGSDFITGNIFNGLSRAGVPLFVMLSGALLLNEDKKFDTHLFFKKSLTWMILLLVGWLLVYGAFYAVVLPISLGEAPSADGFVNFLLTFKGTDYPHLWYMFMVVGMYLIIPVLRLFVQRKNRNYIFWLIVGCGIVQFLTQTLDIFVPDTALINVSDYVGKFHLECMTGYPGYVLAGWYLTNSEIKKSRRYLLYAGSVLSAVISIFAVQKTIDTIPSVRKYFYSELSLPAFLFGIGLFLFIKQLCGNKVQHKARLKNISDCCFGIYIVHVIYLELFTQILLPYENISCGPLAYILLSYCSVLAISLLTVFVIGKIPYIKRIFYIK